MRRLIWISAKRTNPKNILNAAAQIFEFEQFKFLP